MNAVQEHIEAIIAVAGLTTDDVHEVNITPGKVVYTCWARKDDGSIATITSDIGNLPLQYTVIMNIGAEAPHEHGPHTHTHDDVDA